MNTIESRLAAVERQLRFHRAVIAGLLLALVALVGMGATEGVPKVIRARKFVVVNEEGREVVVVESWKHGGWIAAYSAKGVDLSSIVLAHDDNGGLLKVNNKDGEGVIWASPDTHGNGLLAVYNKDGGTGVQLQGMTSRGGGGAVLVHNKTGEEVVHAYADEYGMGYVGTFDRQGKGRTLTPR